MVQSFIAKVSEQLQACVEEQAGAAGLRTSFGEYLRALVRQRQQMRQEVGWIALPVHRKPPAECPDLAFIETGAEDVSRRVRLWYLERRRQR